MYQICLGRKITNFEVMKNLQPNYSKVLNTLLLPSVLIVAIWQSDCSNVRMNWHQVPQFLISWIKLEQMVTDKKKEDEDNDR